MTRGNQREKAREKNNKKKEAEKKKLDGDPKKRMEAQAEIMRQKQKAGEYIKLVLVLVRFVNCEDNSLGEENYGRTAEIVKYKLILENFSSIA